MKGHEAHYRNEEADEQLTTLEGGSMSAFTFLCVVLTLIGLGLVMMYSASYNEALSMGLPHHYFFVRQAMFILLGLACAVVIRFIPIKVIKASAIPLLLVCLALMLLTLFTSYGQVRYGARRWLSIPPLPSFQPSELVKLAVILFLANWFGSAKHEEKAVRRYALPACVVLLFAALILLQRDYSTTIVFLVVSISMFFIAGMSIGWLLLSVAFLAVPAAIALLSQPYRVKRMAAYLFSGMDTDGINWQVSNARAAIAEGGWLGKGLGNGVYKLGRIPEVQNDFIFASIAEETGIAGISLLLLLFFLFGLLGYRTYLRMLDKDKALAYTACGISTMIVVQAMVNICVVTGVLPPTGIPLPFFSQGGTNLFVVICECALLYKIMLMASGRLGGGSRKGQPEPLKPLADFEFPSDGLHHER